MECFGENIYHGICRKRALKSSKNEQKLWNENSVFETTLKTLKIQLFYDYKKMLMHLFFSLFNVRPKGQNNNNNQQKDATESQYNAKRHIFHPRCVIVRAYVHLRTT